MTKKRYIIEMDNLENSMFAVMEKQLKNIDMILQIKYKKSRSEYKKSRIALMMEKKGYFENFIKNVKYGNLDRRMIELLFGYDFRFIQNRKMYIALENFLINIRKEFGK